MKLSVFEHIEGKKEIVSMNMTDENHLKMVFIPNPFVLINKHALTSKHGIEESLVLHLASRARVPPQITKGRSKFERTGSPDPSFGDNGRRLRSKNAVFPWQPPRARFIGYG